MNHQHHNHCSHDSVRYCKVCRIVHCLDCTQEWGPKTNYTWGYTPWYGNTLGNDTAYSVRSATGSADKSAEETKAVCNHGR